MATLPGLRGVDHFGFTVASLLAPATLAVITWPCTWTTWLPRLHTCAHTASGCRVEPVLRREGPNAGRSWIYFLAPWGMQIELVSYLQGMGYERTTQARMGDPRVPRGSPDVEDSRHN